MTRRARAATLRASRRRGMRPSRAYNVFRVIALASVVVVFIFPLVWLVLASLKTQIDIYDPSKTFIFSPTLHNFKTVFGAQAFLPFFRNSLIVGVVSTALSLVFAVPAAYAMSRFSMTKSSIMVLLARVIPSISLIVPWYFLFAKIGMVGGYGAMIISHMFLSVPLMVWILISFFDTLPIELEEAAQVDGLTPIGAFVRVSLPLSIPGIATAGILAFIFSWNNFLFSLILSGSNTKTLPVAIFNFIGYASIDWGGLMAASVSITVPIIAIAMFFQRYVVSGLTAGATKG
ncbi:carbohydrate ABC transporter permease [Demequina lutea]|uniref:Multiple sugar transport system permease protein n=1 Tax=Demequina lutea TaxID=431489 RepID=A0A7Y9ZBW3_9MICO|nr:carbohydrate ABC transporter permease [Demequina lutea]NYI40511.1 multiple sugar transport system permease protein [Demequina lutea]